MYELIQLRNGYWVVRPSSATELQKQTGAQDLIEASYEIAERVFRRVQAGVGGYGAPSGYYSGGSLRGVPLSCR